jgi:hypothetical protein
MKDQDYVIIDKAGSEVPVSGNTAASALSIFLKRGRYGLGSGWIFTRQPNGWIVASNKDEKTLQRTCYKLREVNYSRLDKRFKAISA